MRISDWSSDVCSSDLNPRSTSLDLEARITYADGSTDTWQVPEGSPIGTNLRYYRWRKWLERIRSDSYRGLWRATAEWVADEHSGGPSRSEEHTSELQSLMRSSYAVFCLKTKNKQQ